MHTAIAHPHAHLSPRGGRCPRWRCRLYRVYLCVIGMGIRARVITSNHEQGSLGHHKSSRAITSHHESIRRGLEIRQRRGRSGEARYGSGEAPARARCRADRRHPRHPRVGAGLMAVTLVTHEHGSSGCRSRARLPKCFRNLLARLPNETFLLISHHGSPKDQKSARLPRRGSFAHGSPGSCLCTRLPRWPRTAPHAAFDHESAAA